MSENLGLWSAVEKTPPAHTKPITGKQYNGTSPKPHYLVWKATETFGPCGIGWGFTIEDERIEEGAGGERMSIARVKVWYVWDGKRGEVEHIGGTSFSGTRKNGNTYTDEDAPKKSVTDALIKALSLIGFAGDIFMGRYDDSKYVADLKREDAAPASNGNNQKTAAAPARQVAGAMTATALKAGMKKFVLTELPAVKSLAELKALEARNRDMLDQCISQLPDWWFGDKNQPGAKKRLDERRQALLTFTVVKADGSAVDCDPDNLSSVLDAAFKEAATIQTIAGIWESSNLSEALQTLAEIGRDDVIEAVNLTKQGHQARFPAPAEEVFPDAAE